MRSSQILPHVWMRLAGKLRDMHEERYSTGSREHDKIHYSAVLSYKLFTAEHGGEMKREQMMVCSRLTLYLKRFTVSRVGTLFLTAGS